LMVVLDEYVENDWKVELDIAAGVRMIRDLGCKIAYIPRL
jgi:peroxiredoxin